MRNIFSGQLRLVFTADVYEDRYEAKYFGLPVVRNLYTGNMVLEMIQQEASEETSKWGTHENIQTPQRQNVPSSFG